MAGSLRDNLVFDLDIETLKDYSGGDHNGTANGTTQSTDRFNRLNKARSFNGSSDYISFATNTIGQGQTNISFVFWIKWIVVQSAYIFGKDAGSNKLLAVQSWGDNQLYFVIMDGSNAWGNCSYASLQDGNWHFLAFTYDGTQPTNAGKMRIYQDGANQSLSFTGTIPSSINASFNATSTISRVPLASSGYLNGSLADFKIFHKTLTAAEIQQIYNDTKPAYQGLFETSVFGIDGKATQDFIGSIIPTSDSTTDGTGFLNINKSSRVFGTGTQTLRFSPSYTQSTSSTFSFWLKLNGDSPSGGYSNILIAENPYNFQLFVDNPDDTLKWYSIASSVVSLGYVVPHGEWHHYVYSVSAGTGTLYIDGVQNGGTKSTTVGTGTPLNLQFGARTVTNQQPLDGELSHIIFWTRAITATEVKKLYDLTKTKYIYPYTNKVHLI